MKRSVLERKTPLRSHTSLKRSPMKRRKGKLAKSREFTPEIRNIIHIRSSGICELCRKKRMQHIHHAVFRSHIQVATLSIAIGLCVECHELAHSNRQIREQCVALAKELASGQTDHA